MADGESVVDEIKEIPATVTEAHSEGHSHVNSKTIFIAVVIAGGAFLAYTLIHRKSAATATSATATPAANTTPDSSTLQALTASIDALAQSEQAMQAGTMAAGQAASGASGGTTTATTTAPNTGGNAPATGLQGMANRPAACPGGMAPLQYPDGSWYCPLPPILPAPSTSPTTPNAAGGYNAYGETIGQTVPIPGSNGGMLSVGQTQYAATIPNQYGQIAPGGSVFGPTGNNPFSQAPTGNPIAGSGGGGVFSSGPVQTSAPVGIVVSGTRNTGVGSSTLTPIAPLASDIPDNLMHGGGW